MIEIHVKLMATRSNFYQKWLVIGFFLKMLYFILTVSSPFSHVGNVFIFVRILGGHPIFPRVLVLPLLDHQLPAPFSALINSEANVYANAIILPMLGTVLVRLFRRGGVSFCV